MSKKIISLLLVAMLSVGLFAGCGGTKEEPAPAEPNEPVASSEESKTDEASSEAPAEAGDISGEITFSAWDIAVNDKYLIDLKDAFEAKYPGTTVKINDIPSNDYNEKLNVDLNGGAAADVFLIKQSNLIYPLTQKGQLEDMTPYIEKSGMDLTSFNGLAEPMNIDGQQTGLPHRTDYYVLFYNKDIFDAANEPYPTNDMTWKEFEEVAQRITTGEGATKHHGAYLHTWQACVQNWTIQDGKNTIMGPDYEFMKPGYEMALRMQDAGTIPDFATLQSAQIHYSSPFQQGTVGMLPMGSWYMATMIQKINDGETSVNWGIATIPHPEGVEAGNTVGASTPIAINKASKNKDTAWAFIEFMTSPEATDIMTKAGKIPGNLDDSMLEVIASADGMPEGTKDALQVKNIYLDRPTADHVNEVDQMLKEEHSLIMLGENSINDGIAEITTRSAEIQAE